MSSADTQLEFPSVDSQQCIISKQKRGFPTEKHRLAVSSALYNDKLMAAWICRQKANQYVSLREWAARTGNGQTGVINAGIADWMPNQCRYMYHLCTKHVTLSKIQDCISAGILCIIKLKNLPTPTHRKSRSISRLSPA